MSRRKKKLITSLTFSAFNEDDSGELIQLIAPDEDEGIDREPLSDMLPVLPIRNTVLFPGVVIPITVGRQKSIRLVKNSYRGDRIIGVVAQKNNKKEEPGFDDLYNVGTVARIVKMLVLPDGNTTIIIQGKQRFAIEERLKQEPFMTAKVKYLDDNFPSKNKKETKAILQSIKDSAYKILKLNPEIPQEAQIAIDNIDSPSFLTHFLSSNLSAEVDDKQKLLEINNGPKRATLLLEYMMKDIQMLELKQKIQNKVHSDIDQQQRDYFLRQQIKILQDELGNEGPDNELNLLKEKAKKKKWELEVREHFDKECDKIMRMNPAAAEYPVSINYVEFLIDLPWNDFTKDNFDLKRAQKILDRDHYGLVKIKERIIEFLAVRKLKNDLKGPILCLYGPPGVGKTSLGKSVAKALNRKYVRMSLGGVHDEAEIRGHRKTYVGAMPGKIIHHIKKIKSANPVFVLDEIDKVSSDFRGDPSSALLEVLDPEQNNTFSDNYLELDYNLSNVLFIATANRLDTI
ncbi:MAG: LON peptidase substrate-binding domain-containing protein, partial [Cyclobacteriaceae bacterium]|nr:LON peptidase substrate-binding domain-containing protein [Cyclobacteriaceae bacterium]